VLFTLQHWDEASGECEKAVKLDGQSSIDYMWFARTLGERADRASFLSAFSMAKRAREEFEEAVRLDPRNAEALADLGEFYTAAPGVVGGGADKAEGIAVQLDKVDPARADELRGRIAESRKDYGAAEREFKQAISVGEHQSFHWMTLGSFYLRRKSLNEMEEAVQSGVKAAQKERHSGVALYDGASILSRGNRNLALASKMFEEYLAGSSKTEEAPAFEAHTRLARLKAQLGDTAGARQERAKALELAHDYKPALALKF
jgi:tetratricopeptide (TPR) repeat protein